MPSLCSCLPLVTLTRIFLYFSHLNCHDGKYNYIAITKWLPARCCNAPACCTALLFYTAAGRTQQSDAHMRKCCKNMLACVLLLFSWPQYYALRCGAHSRMRAHDLPLAVWALDTTAAASSRRSSSRTVVPHTFRLALRSFTSPTSMALRGRALVAHHRQSVTLSTWQLSSQPK